MHTDVMELDISPRSSPLVCSLSPVFFWSAVRCVDPYERENPELKTLGIKTIGIEAGYDKGLRVLPLSLHLTCVLAMYARSRPPSVPLLVIT